MKKYMSIDRARRVLKLPESATIPEIKQAYRKLSLRYHPDKCMEKNRKKCEEKFKEINNANEILIKYCLNHRFFFKKIQEEEAREGAEMAEHLKKFYDGWWGDLDI